jgi:pyruvate formate lyase activating enzyme
MIYSGIITLFRQKITFIPQKSQKGFAMNIYGIQKTTLVDFPGHVATTLFTAGCNFRCPYCHNGDLVENITDLSPYDGDEIFSLLKKRASVIEGVVISGGEPTLQPDLPDFIREIKALGYLVKLDTNGSHPAMLQQLVKDKLVDYVAMDIKHCRTKYNTVANQADFDLNAIAASVDFLKEGHVSYEFRITLCRELHKEEDMTAIGLWLMGASACYLQPYRESDQVLQPGFHPPEETELQTYRKILSAFIPQVEIRGGF